MATWNGQTFGSLGEEKKKKKRLLRQYHSHEAMYRKRHLKYNDKIWELNNPICLSQNCFLTHYLLTISININAKIISLWMIGSSIVSTSILSVMIYFNKVILNKAYRTIATNGRPST